MDFDSPEGLAFRRAFFVSTIMIIKLVTNYSKHFGLPGFSSHQLSVSVETELLAADDIPGLSVPLPGAMDLVEGNLVSADFKSASAKPARSMRRRNTRSSWCPTNF